MKRIKMTEEEIKRKYPGLPPKGAKFHTHNKGAVGGKMNRIIDRYIYIDDEEKKWLKVVFEFSDENGKKDTRFELFK